MEELKNKILDIDVFCDQGILLICCKRENIPICIQMLEILYRNPNKFYVAIKDLVKIFNLDGIHDFDVMYDKKNNIKLLK